MDESGKTINNGAFAPHFNARLIPASAASENRRTSSSHRLRGPVGETINLELVSYRLVELVFEKLFQYTVRHWH